jgi:type VI protein secretion system component VasF
MKLNELPLWMYVIVIAALAILVLVLVYLVWQLVLIVGIIIAFALLHEILHWLRGE